MRTVKKIPLEVRLERVEKGYASDPEYNFSIVKLMANVPIKVYLGAFEKEYVELKELLKLTDEYMENATYKDIANQIHTLPNIPISRRNICVRNEAIRILTLPFHRFYERKIWMHEKNRKN